MNNKKEIRLLIKYFVKQSLLILKLAITEIRKPIKSAYDSFIEKLRFSIAFKINIAFVSMIIGFFFFLSLAIAAGFGFYLGYSAKVDMEKDVSLITSYSNGNIESIYESIDKISKLKNRQISIFDYSEKLVFTSEVEKNKVYYYVKDKSSQASQDSYVLISGSDISFHFPTNAPNTSSRLFMVLNKNITIGNKNYKMQVVNKLVTEFMYLGILFSALAIICIITIINTLITGWKASKKILKPVERMSETVQNITINALDTRLDIGGSQDELKDLAHTFNDMLDRLQESYEKQNQFVSDASHELRTPIAVIQGYANLLDRWGKNDKEVLEESITAIKSESENMKALVEQLLFLARSDKNTQKVEKADFYIDELIEVIVKETKLIDTKHHIMCEKNERAKLNADRNLVKEALRIFIDNSIKYTPENGFIKINSYVTPEDLSISVQDSGNGISKEDLPHIFDRFYRADKSRTKQSGGTGLGLAIAKWIVMKHSGTIEVESQLGVGTKINIKLPKENS